MFVLAYDNTAGNNQASVESFKKYFLSRVKTENCNIKIDGRSFHDQPVNESIKQYDKVRKISTEKVMITRLVVYFAYFEKNYGLIVADLSKQKALDDDSRAIRQVIYAGNIKSTVANARVIIYYILKQSKETLILKYCNSLKE